MLTAKMESETKDTLTLKTNVDVEVHTCSYKSVRGYSVCSPTATKRSSP